MSSDTMRVEPVRVEPMRVEPFGGPVDVVVGVPGSKSLSNRALLIAALAEGVSNIDGLLIADDTEAMLSAARSLGAELQLSRDDCSVRLTGTSGAMSNKTSEVMSVDARQSGTTSRFVLPVLAATPGQWLLDGHPQLRLRPFDDQLTVLRDLGADITEVGEPGCLPLRISGRRLEGGSVEIAGNASSQFLSGLLIAAPMMASAVTFSLTSDLVSRAYVDLTVAVMAAFGVDVEAQHNSWRVRPGRYKGCAYKVEPDASSASYFFGAAAIAGGRCRINGLGRGSLQGDLGFVDVLASMGAVVTKSETWTEVVVRTPLTGTTIDMSQISDTAQTLAVVASTANGPTEVSGIAFIQAKETRRIDAVVSELTRVGVTASATADGFIVEPGPAKPGTIQTYDDHRMAMSFALLGLVEEGISIADPSCVNKTFPSYWAVLESMRPSKTVSSKTVSSKTVSSKAVSSKTVSPRAVPKVVALDGPAGSGKSTVAAALAAELEVRHFDTGAMYRAVTYAVLRDGVDPHDSEAVADLVSSIEIELNDRVIVDGVDATAAIRSAAVTALVSVTSAVPQVRAELIRVQREWALNQDGAVLDGRDIGTVVFPEAPVKAYLTARVDVRAERRFGELSGLTVTEIAADIERRDQADSRQSQVADDAVRIDTSDRTVTDIVNELAALTRSAWAELGSRNR